MLCIIKFCKYLGFFYYRESFGIQSQLTNFKKKKNFMWHCLFVFQDWYTYQLMCLQVIEFFKSCPDFLPKILEHIGTSGIMNSLQYITQVPVDDMKNNILTVSSIKKYAIIQYELNKMSFFCLTPPLTGLFVMYIF